MKSLCLILLVALSLPGCSMFHNRSRQDPAYTKYLKKLKRDRDRQHAKVIHQRAEMPSLRTPPLGENMQSQESH